MVVQIQLRRDLAADWTSNNPTLAEGELGFETDTGKFKIGDGTTAWTALGYSAGIDDDAIHDNVAAEISAIANKGVPVGADYLLIEDSAAGDAKKHTLVSELEAILNHDALTNFVAAEHKLDAAIDHDALLNFVAAEHKLEAAINHDALTNFEAGEHFTLLDEDDFATDSATQAPSQQSVKQWVGNNLNPTPFIVGLINGAILSPSHPFTALYLPASDGDAEINLGGWIPPNFGSSTTGNLNILYSIDHATTDREVTLRLSILSETDDRDAAPPVFNVLNTTFDLVTAGDDIVDIHTLAINDADFQPGKYFSIQIFVTDATAVRIAIYNMWLEPV